MRIAYLDCFAGIAGDMFLGALLDAGVPADVLHHATTALNLGASLEIETVDRSGISSTKVHVLEKGRLADELQPGETHVNGASGVADESGLQDQNAGREFERMPQLRTQHQHKTGHPRSHAHESQQHAAPEHSHGSAPATAVGPDPHHTHGHDHDHGEAHEHGHGRSLTEIRALIQGAPLDAPVKDLAIRAFELLGYSEAKIHNVPVDEIHFHEVGAVDAIVDIVACSAGIHHLGVGAWYCSPVNVGAGMVRCAHGTFPVPAPATADLLRGFPTYSAHVQKELVTPTGAALLRALNPVFGPQPAMSVEAIGYGAGSRNPKDFPNVLRLSVGEAAASATHSQAQAHPSNVSSPDASRHPHHEGETVTVLETALDDLSPQLIAYVTEKALAEGALDIMLTPVIMKKGRPGTLLSVLCTPADTDRFTQMILSETSTLGVRIRQDRRVCLERRHSPVDTEFGPIRMKIGTQDGDERNAAPEYEDCRAAAAQARVPLKWVQQAAIAAYAGRRSR